MVEEEGIRLGISSRKGMPSVMEAQPSQHYFKFNVISPKCYFSI